MVAGSPSAPWTRSPFMRMCPMPWLPRFDSLAVTQPRRLWRRMPGVVRPLLAWTDHHLAEREARAVPLGMTAE